MARSWRGGPAVLALWTAACAASRGPGPDQTLVVVYPAATPWEEDSVALNGNVLEPLVDLDANQQPRGALASNWYNPDDRTWIFELRAGLRRHDGQVVDAPQVVAALEALRERPGLAGAVFRPVESLRAIDARRIELRTRGVYGTLVYQLMLAMPRFGGTREQPLGTGPYRVESRESGRITLVAAETASSQPAIRRARFEVVKDGAERVRRLLSGEAHLALDVPATESEALRRSPGHRLVVRRGLRLLFLGFDCARTSWLESPGGPNPFRDARVRRAVALALDRPRLARETLHGFATPFADLADQDARGPDAAPEPAQDLEAARGLLAEAGYAGGFEAPLEYTQGRLRDAAPIVEAVARDLAPLGVRVVPRPQADLLERLQQGRAQFYLSRVVLDGPNAGSYYDAFLHTRAGSRGLFNGGGYSDPEVDALIEAAEGELKPASRGPLLARIVERVRRDAPLVPLAVLSEVSGADGRLRFEARRDRRVLLADLSFAPR